MQIIRVTTGENIQLIKELFLEYAVTLNLDLSFQNFQQELASLPGAYSPPTGCILLAEENGAAAGCVALRSLTAEIGEMKRLYVRPEYRGKGAGKLLSGTIIAEARSLGYRKMRLDTLDSMKEAVLLYRKLGFYEIEPYRFNPLPGAIYMELKL